MVNVRKVVEKLDPYVPGKSIKEIAHNYGLDPREIIKLGSNENPVGPSPKAVEAVAADLKFMNQYPESDLKILIESVASYSGVKPSQVILGGDGADELLDILGKTLINPGDEFIVHIPTYMYYEFTLNIHGAIPVYAQWNVAKNNLDVNSILEAISPRTKIIFLCTPNNPTGGLIDKKDIITILESTKALIVVDEAYWEYSGVNNVDLLAQYKNLFILRTFSKVMGLAGMRVGYGLGTPDFIGYMNRVKPVFSLTRPSQIAAKATLKDYDYINKSTQLGIESREYLYGEMSKIPDLKVFESKANYLLVDIRRTGMDSDTLTEKLLQKGIIVRNCCSFHGLDKYWIRVSVGTLEDDKRFITVLREIIG